MLAQFDLEPWHVYTGSVIGILTVIVALWIRISNNRAEHRREDAKERREQARDDEHTSFLRKIADSNVETAKGVIILGERLEGQQKLMVQMHTENRQMLPTVCPYNKPVKRKKRK